MDGKIIIIILHPLPLNFGLHNLWQTHVTIPESQHICCQHLSSLIHLQQANSFVSGTTSLSFKD